MGTITATPPPWPDDSLNYAPLPASGDDGFPQVFLAQIQQTVYRLTLSVYYMDPGLVLGSAYANTMFDLPDPDPFDRSGRGFRHD